MFLFCVMLMALPVLALTQEPDVDVSDPSTIVAYLSPFIVLVATAVVKAAKANIPGWATMLVVTALSALVTWLTNLLGTPDLSWLVQFGLGLAATFVHQVYRQFSD